MVALVYMIKKQVVGVDELATIEILLVILVCHHTR